MKLLSLCIFSILTFAQKVDISKLNSFDYSRTMHKKVSSIGKILPKNFGHKVSKIRREIDQFVEHKKGVCQGNFSTIILDEGNEEQADYKLTKGEQELCYRELKALQVTYINELYQARRKYLIFLHEQRIKMLSDVREEALKQIQATFNKKSKHSRKRRSASRVKAKKKQ